MAGGKNIYSPEARQPQRFEFKAGTNGFQWKGHMLEGDPASIPANRPRLLINARLSNGVIRPRAGTADYASGTDTLPGCVIALNETETNVRMYYTIEGCGAFLGGTLLSINQDEFTETRTLGSYFSGSNTVLRLAEYGGSVYLGAVGALKKFQDNIDEPTSTGFTIKDTIVKDFTGTATNKNTITMLQGYEGNFYIGISNTNTGAVAIWKYDGVTMAVDVTPTAFEYPHASCLWREFLVVGQGGLNRIRYRNATGTWTTVAPGAGTIVVPAGDNQMVSYQDKVYLCSTGGGVNSIWAYDGTTLSNVRSPAAAALVAGVTVFNGYLYYAWFDATTGYIGRYDGTTWADTHKNLTAQFTNVRYLGGFTAFREQLYVGVAEKMVIASDGYNTSGSWVGTNPTASTVDAAFNFVVI